MTTLLIGDLNTIEQINAYSIFHGNKLYMNIGGEKTKTGLELVDVKLRIESFEQLIIVGAGLILLINSK